MTTIEGVSGPVAAAVQKAWVAIDVPQCGFCQSGQVMSAIGLLAAKPKPTDADIDAGMAGNICRCATYVRIRQAIKDAAERQGAGMNAPTADRRQFLAGSGLVLGLMLPMRGAKATVPPADGRSRPNAFVRVLPDNTVTVVIKHVEFGQGPATGLTTIVADEMDADWCADAHRIRAGQRPALQEFGVRNDGHRRLDRDGQ